MKLTWKQIEPFVKKPDPKARVILIYGPDNGLMKERAKAIGKTVVDDLNDPFNAVTLAADKILEDAAILNDEASAMSMMGGGRLIRIEDAADKIAPIIKDYLQDPSEQNLIVIEAAELGPRSALRALCEKAKNAAALPCYVEDERGIANLIRNMISENENTIQSDAVSWLAAAIAGDRGRARKEIEKLILYMGDEKNITIDHVIACCGEAGTQTLDKLIYCVAGGQPKDALKTYNVLLDEGVPTIAILRALQNHFRRLHLTKSRLAEGDTIDIAMKALTPPIFFKLSDPFKTQVNRWSLQALSQILDKLAHLEAQTKKTGTPVETLCGQALLAISSR